MYLGYNEVSRFGEFNIWLGTLKASGAGGNNKKKLWKNVRDASNANTNILHKKEMKESVDKHDHPHYIYIY